MAETRSARMVGRDLAISMVAPLTMALALVGCGGGRAAASPSTPHPLLGKTVPDFKRPAIDGSSVDTPSLRGRVVVVKFFAKYCVPCRETLPAVERIHQNTPDVAFVGIDEDERSEDAVTLVSTYRLSFPVLHDRGNVLSGRFRTSDLPITFVVDARGIIRWVGGPGQTENDIVAAIAAARN